MAWVSILWSWWEVLPVLTWVYAPGWLMELRASALYASWGVFRLIPIEELSGGSWRMDGGPEVVFTWIWGVHSSSWNPGESSTESDGAIDLPAWVNPSVLTSKKPEFFCDSMSQSRSLRDSLEIGAEQGETWERLEWNCIGKVVWSSMGFVHHGQHKGSLAKSK